MGLSKKCSRTKAGANADSISMREDFLERAQREQRKRVCGAIVHRSVALAGIASKLVRQIDRDKCKSRLPRRRAFEADDMLMPLGAGLQFEPAVAGVVSKVLAAIVYLHVLPVV